jgi:hypothetical protein
MPLFARSPGSSRNPKILSAVGARELKNIKPEDRFWFFLSRLLEIKNITIFTPKAVEYINYKLKKRLV